MKSDIYEVEKAGIEQLRKADVNATLTQDPGALSMLWADDGINLQTPGNPTIGIAALKTFYEKFRSDYPEFKVLEYSPEFRELQLVEGWAIELIDANATLRMSAKDEPVRVQTKLVRVLKRQSDGSWKFALVSPK
jgi:ketosteroid isomerase-like protein